MMHRVTDKGHIRYYRIELFQTLFGEFVVEREYGNIQNKGATGHRKTTYPSIDEAKDAFKIIVGMKQKKGYR